MLKPIRTDLTVPARADLLPLLRDHLTHLVGLARLDEDNAARLTEAAVEACANVIDHAYLPGEIGPLQVVGEVNAAEIVIAVCDQGLPLAKEGSPDDRPARVSASNGMELIRNAVDRAWWVHKGREGKELRLLKLLPARTITEELGPIERLDDSFPLAPEQEYTIRRFQPADAVGVSRCIYEVYGNTYVHEDCYYPERLVRHNETGTLTSIVALDADDQVVGHYALERPTLGPVAERGIAVVSPRHRGRELMGRMRRRLEDEARALGLVGVWSFAVTRHVASQRVNETFGSCVCGVLFAGCPAEMDFRGFAPAHSRDRVSGVLYFTLVGPAHDGPRHLPDRHREVAGRIYESLDLPATFAASEEPSGPGRVDVSYSRNLDAGVIRVLRAGVDTAAEIRRAARDRVEVTGADIVELHLPLAQPATPHLAARAEADGFFFAGIGPAFLDDGDALILQLVTVPVDPDTIHVANPFAGDLVGYIDADRHRVASAVA
jgi:anti-sigma regulatory factor (Ser/Thr protein kinase)